MRLGSKAASDINFYNKEVALNELLAALGDGLTTATITSYSDSATAQELLAANSDRKGCIIFNNSPVILYVALGATATTSAFSYRLTPYATLELFAEKNFTGSISGIWASDSTGAGLVTELSL